MNETLKKTKIDYIGNYTNSYIKIRLNYIDWKRFYKWLDKLDTLFEFTFTYTITYTHYKIGDMYEVSIRFEPPKYLVETMEETLENDLELFLSDYKQWKEVRKWKEIRKRAERNGRI